MRKIGWLFIVVFLFINNSYGQTEQDRITSFKKVNKWAVVKLTIAYMEDLKGWPQKNAKRNQELETYTKLKEDYDSYLENVDLEEVSSLLLKGWKRTRENVFENYRKELVDNSLTMNSFENISFVPVKVSETKRREAIKVQYTSFLPNIIEKEKEILKVEEVVYDEKSPTLTSTNKEKSSLLNIIVYVALVISLLLILFLIIVLKKVFKKLEVLEKEDKKRLRRVQVDHNTESKFNGNIELLNSKIRSLEKQNYELLNDLNSTKNSFKSDRNDSPVEDKKSLTRNLNVTKSQQDLTKLIYFPSPFEDNRFSNEDVSETQVPFSLYLAKIDSNTNQGAISLIETADLSRALNSPNTFLEPVCNYENAYSSSTKEIKVIAKGDVVLEGEDWVVKTKIRIKFI
ncbi:hypothetical protein [Polaribacter staleyi]|uniref:hypothetical protein n=1 Tax=Polaribacter staleyi TaxID=2022337 RepID=UPI0031BA403C